MSSPIPRGEAMKCCECGNPLPDGDYGLACLHCRSTANYMPTVHVCRMKRRKATRWHVKPPMDRILQQKWRCVNCGRVEWQDVPVEYAQPREGGS